jgi:hypothetical protein
MKRFDTWVVIAALAMGVLNAKGEDAAAPAPTPEDSIKQLADLGPGVHKVKKDEGGHLQSCVIVGQSRISTVLGPAKGLETARKRARMNAQAEFVRWMKTAVAAVQLMSDSSMVVLKGDGNTVSENGKAVEMTSDNVSTLSEGVLRGMTIIGAHQDGKAETMTIVYGWTPKYAALAEEAKEINKRPGDAAAQAPTGHPVERGAVDSKTTVSGEAKDFLK